MAQVTTRAVLGGYEATVEESSTESRASAEATRQEKIKQLLERAHKRFQTSKSGEASLRENQRDDQVFAAGSTTPTDTTQWNPAQVIKRALAKKPLITINRQPAFIRQVTGAMRQQPQSILVQPRDNDADPQTAEVYQGLIRTIEANSIAEVAYSTAADHQVTIGRGWLRVQARYASDTSFDIDLFIGRLLNPLAVFPDPASVEFDGSDMRFLFLVHDLPKDEYLARYGKVPGVDNQVPTTADFRSMGWEDYSGDWAPEGNVKVAEYWWVEVESDIALLLIPTPYDGSEPIRRFASECGDLAESTEIPGPGQGVHAGFIATVDGQPYEVIRKKNGQRRVIKSATIDGLHILEGNEDLTDGAIWPGDRIPFVPVIGQEMVVNGKVDYRGLVRDNKQPARAFNFYVTELTQAISNAPKSPWIVEMRAIKTYKAIWDSANQEDYAYLPYDSRNQDDPTKPFPEPKRAFGEPSGISAIVQAIIQFDNAMKAVTGLYDASLGERGPEQSGRAVLARQQQGNTGTAHFPANMALAKQAIGRMLVQLIPHYYDAGRIVRILGTDDQARSVMVYAGSQNAPTPADQAQIFQKLGVRQPADGAASPSSSAIRHIFDLGAGHYDVTVSTGPYYPTMRAETADMLLKLAQAVPAVAQAAPDLIVGAVDFPGSQKLSKRLRKVMGVDDDEAGQPEISPAVKAELSKGQAVIDALTAEVNGLKDTIQTKALELQSKEDIARAQIEAKLATEQARLASAEQITLLQAKLDDIARFLDLAESDRTRQLDAQQQAAQAQAAAQGQPAAAAAAPAAGGVA